MIRVPPAASKYRGTELPRVSTLQAHLLLAVLSAASNFHATTTRTSMFVLDYHFPRMALPSFLLTSGCGGVVSSATGSFASPAYPQPYHHNAECEWHVRVADGSKIQFVFADIDLEQADECE